MDAGAIPFWVAFQLLNHWRVAVIVLEISVKLRPECLEACDMVEHRESRGDITQFHAPSSHGGPDFACSVKAEKKDVYLDNLGLGKISYVVQGSVVALHADAAQGKDVGGVCIRQGHARYAGCSVHRVGTNGDAIGIVK